MMNQRTSVWTSIGLTSGRNPFARILTPRIAWMASAILIGLILGGCGPAGTFVVNNNGDSGDNNPGDGVCRINAVTTQCTLRAAIEEANALAGANTINFNLPAGSLTIHPLTPLPVITEDVDINAFTQPGFVSDPIVVLEGTLVAAPAANGLEIANGVTADFRGLRIQEFTGDGIHNKGNLELWSHFLLNNGGNGLFSDGSPGSVDVHLVSTHFAGNARAGINAVNTNFDMSNDDVTDNDSGGIALAGGDIIMDNSRIMGNTAHLGGGGMDLHVKTNAAFTDVTVTGNSTTDIGGGILFAGDPGATMVFVNGSITRNTSTLGGGLYIESSVVHLNNDTVADNRATSDGGGVYLKKDPAGSSALWVEGGTVIGRNVADSDHDGTGQGGGIFCQDQVQIADSTVEANTGDGIYNDGGEIRMQDSLVQLNTRNGVMSFISGTPVPIRVERSRLLANDYHGVEGINIDLTVAESTVQDNQYGGIFMSGGDLIVTDSTIADNHASNNGGGIGAMNISTAEITGTAIWGNNAGDYGGGVYLHALIGGHIQLGNVTIHGNRAGITGGGAYIDSGPVDLNNVTVTQNAAGGGGGIDNHSPAVRLSNSIIAENTGGNCQGSLTSAGFNLEDTATCSLTGPGDLAGVPVPLGPMQDNGGPTFTREIFDPGPAVDTANDATCEATDQRGVARPQGAHCDKGAFELEPAGTPAPKGPTPTATETLTAPATTFTPTATLPAVTYTATPTAALPAASYELEYQSGSGQTYGGGGMPLPMVFKIKNTTTDTYINQALSLLNLSMTATASLGYQDAEFNNLNNYNGLGTLAYGGYYYVPPNGGPAYTLQVTVTLSLNGAPVDTYLITENITGVTPTRTPTRTLPPANYELEYQSGSGQTYGGGGMPLPMVFKIKNTTTDTYINQTLSLLNLSMTATASLGYQDAEFNNLNNYNGLGTLAYGGYYYVPPNGGPAYTLQVTVTLYLNGSAVDTYLITENITGKTPTPTIGRSKISFNSAYFSDKLIYHGGKTCKPKQLTIRVQILPAGDVPGAVVLLRLDSVRGTQTGTWSPAYAMTSQGDGWFQYILSGDAIPGVSDWTADALLAVQFGANDKNGSRLATSSVYRSVTVALCQR